MPETFSLAQIMGHDAAPTEAPPQSFSLKQIMGAGPSADRVASFSQQAPIQQNADDAAHSTWDQYGQIALQSHGAQIREYAAKVMGMKPAEQQAVSAGTGAPGQMLPATYSPEQLRQAAAAYVRSTLSPERATEIEQRARQSYLANALPQAVDQQTATAPGQPTTPSVGRVHGVLNAVERGTVNDLLLKQIRAGANYAYDVAQADQAEPGLHGAQGNATRADLMRAATNRALDPAIAGVEQQFAPSDVARANPHGLQAMVENAVEAAPSMLAMKGVATPGAAGVEATSLAGMQGAQQAYDRTFADAKAQGMSDLDAHRAADAAAAVGGVTNAAAMRFGALAQAPSQGASALIRGVKGALRGGAAQTALNTGQRLVGEEVNTALTGAPVSAENIVGGMPSDFLLGAGFGGTHSAVSGRPHQVGENPTIRQARRGQYDVAPAGQATEGGAVQKPAVNAPAGGDILQIKPGQADEYGVQPAPPQTTTARPMRLPDPPADLHTQSNAEIRNWMQQNGYNVPAAKLFSKTQLLTELRSQQTTNVPHGPATLPPDANSWDAGQLRKWAKDNDIELPNILEVRRQSGSTPDEPPRRAIHRFLQQATGAAGQTPVEPIPGAPQEFPARPQQPTQARPETLEAKPVPQGPQPVPHTMRPAPEVPTADRAYETQPEQRTIPLAGPDAQQPAGPETYGVAPGRPERTAPVQPYGTATPEQRAAHGAVAEGSRQTVHPIPVDEGTRPYLVRGAGEHTAQENGSIPLAPDGTVPNRPGSQYLPQQKDHAAIVKDVAGGKVVDPATLHESHQEVLRVGKELTGQDMIPYTGGKGRGFHLAGDVYYNADRNITLAHKREAIAHEATHWLQANKPELVKPIADAIPDSLREKFDAEYVENYKAQEGKELDPRQRQRELEAFAVGKAFSRPAVAKAVMRENPGAFARAAGAVMEKLRSLTAGGRLTNQIIESLRQAREEAGGVKTEPAKAGAEGGEFLPNEEPRRKLPKMPELGLGQTPKTPGLRPIPRAIPDVEKLPKDPNAFKAFVDSDGRNAAGAVKALWKGTADLFGKQSGEEAHIARGIWRKRGAELQHRFDQLHTALDATASHVDKNFTKDQMRAATDAWEAGAPQPKSEIQHAVDSIKQAQDDRWSRINQLDPGGTGYIENYFRHQFKDPKQAGEVLSQYAAQKRLGGNSGFRQTRDIPTMAQARALGLEEAEPNPIKNGIAALHNMDKYLTALEARKDMAANGLLKDAPEKGMPAGWRKVNDPLFKGKIVPEPVASLMDNILDPGLTSSQKFGRLARATLGAGNVANMYQLGLNLFHVAKTSWEAIKSEGAQGTRSLLSIPGDLKEGNYPEAAAHTVTAGMKYLMAGTGFGPIVRDFMEGSRIRKEWLKPGSTDADTAAMVNLLKEAGHRAIPDSTWRTGFTDSMKKAWQEGNPISAALRLPLAAMEKVTEPILQQYVPRIKNGVAAEMVRAEMADLGPNPDINDVRGVLGRAIDSVDNRFGMMVADNLFWHRSVRDIGHLMIRALSYQTGTTREFGGAAKDVLMAVGQAAQGKGKFTDTLRSNRLAYSLTSPVMAAIAGGITTYALTGHAPQQALDYFYPDSGKKDADGKPIRLKLPNYENDIYSFTKDPIQTLRNKESGLVGIASGLATGKDFRGIRISEESPFTPKGVWDRMAWAAGELEPISSQNTRRMIAEGEGTKSFLPEIGITQAGRGMDWSDAEREGHRILAQQSGEGGRSEEQAMRSDVASQLSEGIRNGDPNAGKALSEAVKSGKLPPGEIDKVIKRATGSQGIQGLVERIKEPQSLMRVWDRMNADEKKTTVGAVIGRITDASSLTPDEMQRFLTKISTDMRAK